ncbi:uncharacterized protein LACBIDRAFT_308174 [Laccaria bicolor S238N-H82]|uniref:Predicted protein n=1 Tax=Laccaria bicolor (strain S238N-H82 / ATCC MYA-4686) TaxID=486041 RepID=B0DRS2_LACBS|nr:uncharacterized protein LACBIDRAFT_308174 [Laccaria bicolor S238N-H82]EDR02659.1 predicted protein [Laccaria bicolor S238N-H82]|eukprot:XP_001886703.1 predicted protein [Laccaria bicolor S238N-H82]
MASGRKDTSDVKLLQESAGAASAQTVTVVIDRERLRQVETLLQHLNQPPLVPTAVNEPNVLEGNVESDGLGSPMPFSAGNPLEGLRHHLGHRPLHHSPVPSPPNHGALCHRPLHHSPVPYVRNLGALQENTKYCEVETIGHPYNDNPLFSLPQDRCYEQSKLQDLTAAFTCLYIQQSWLKHWSLVPSPYPAWFLGDLSFS